MVGKIVFYLLNFIVFLASVFIFLKSLIYLFQEKSDNRYGFISILLLIISFFTLLSVFTFDIQDLSIIFTMTPHNAGGILGVLIAKYLLLVFGFESLFIPVILILIAYVLVKRNINNRYIILLFNVYIFLLILFPFIDFKIIMKYFSLGKEGDFFICGTIGNRCIHFLNDYLGNAGIILLLLVFGIAIIYFIHPFDFYFGRKKRKHREEIKAKPASKDIVIKKKQIIEEKKEENIIPEKHEKIKINVHKALIESRFDEIYKDEFKKEFLSLLEIKDREKINISSKELENKAEILVNKLKEFDVNGRVSHISTGPVITMFEFIPAKGVKVSKIANLNEDLSLALKAEKIRMIVPLSGKSAIGIEVPNKKRENVYLFDILTSNIFRNARGGLIKALGKDTSGAPYIANITKMPHLLIAGTTGSGKSVCVNTIVASLLYRSSPKDVRFIMIDPKRLELPVYEGIPHLVRPVITESKEAVNVLKKIVEWMDFRYKQFAKVGVRDLDGYNEKAEIKKPYIVILIDELSDLIMTAPGDIEQNLTRLAQMSRAVGIHLILATQRPSVDVITGLIKANFPARIAFQVASKTDSRTILDMNGAEKLLGRGDMLFLPPGKGKPVRLHGAYISTGQAKQISSMWAKMHLVKLLDGKVENPKSFANEILNKDIVSAIANRDGVPGAKEIIDNFARSNVDRLNLSHEEIVTIINSLCRNYYPYIEENSEVSSIDNIPSNYIEKNNELDNYFDTAKEIVIRHQTASVSLLQRQLKIGYARAGRLIDQLEEAGIVGPYVGSKSREVLGNSDDL
jgi:S-DNA-T family DNA segregation ATPase FtsK/SpoIIIE